MIIPHDQLQAETLQALMEEFVTRDGAVHGHTETPLATQIAAVMRSLKAGKAVIVFDEATETCSIMLREEADALLSRQDSDDVEGDARSYQADAEQAEET